MAVVQGLLPPRHRCFPVRSRRHGRNPRALLRRLPLASGSLSGSWDQAQLFAHFGFQFRVDVAIIFQELAGIFPSLPNALALVAES